MMLLDDIVPLKRLILDNIVALERLTLDDLVPLERLSNIFVDLYTRHFK